MENFDIIRTSEYVVTETNLVNSFKSKFENCKVEVDPNNYRETYNISNGKEPVIRYQMQSQVRKTSLNNILLYLDFPINFFIEDVRSTPYGHFNYEIMKEFCHGLDIESIGAGELTDKILDNDQKYPTILRDLYATDYEWRDDDMYNSIAWRDQYQPEQYWSFMKYGQLGVPLLDRPNQFFIGSAHSLFSAHLAKFKFMPLYIQIPSNQKNWFMKMPSALFQEKQKPFIKEESKFTYLFYVDLENKSLWGKKSYHTDTSTVDIDIKDQEKDLNTYTKLL